MDCHLDLGMGAGRTAYTFAAVARSYIGVDYPPRKVARSRERLGESADATVLGGDARDLSRPFPPAPPENYGAE